MRCSFDFPEFSNLGRQIEIGSQNPIESSIFGISLNFFTSRNDPFKDKKSIYFWNLIETLIEFLNSTTHMTTYSGILFGFPEWFHGEWTTFFSTTRFLSFSKKRNIVFPVFAEHSASWHFIRGKRVGIKIWLNSRTQWLQKTLYQYFVRFFVLDQLGSFEGVKYGLWRLRTLIWFSKRTQTLYPDTLFKFFGTFKVVFLGSVAEIKDQNLGGLETRISMFRSNFQVWVILSILRR